MLLCFASLCLLALLFVRRPWAVRVMQLGLGLGTIEWVRTLLSLIALRRHAGEPYTRLGIILGSVAAVTALSALVFRSRTLRQRFRIAPVEDAPQ
jgi:hypothetical protein